MTIFDDKIILYINKEKNKDINIKFDSETKLEQLQIFEKSKLNAKSKK